VRPEGILGIYREPIFSPGKVREDAAILDRTLAEFSRLGCETRSVQAEALESSKPWASLVLTMAQSDRTLRILEEWHRLGVRVINAVSAVRNCYREPLIRVLTETGIPVPASRISSLEGVEGCTSFGTVSCYWLKRGDVHALSPADVVKVASRKELTRSLEHFYRQKVGKVLIQEHVEGRPVKFYGVGEGDYFRAFAASGEEVTSGSKALASLSRRSAGALGLEIYGGDAILTGEGKPVLVDLNDWPSFSRCSESAAKAIARYVWKCKGENAFPQVEEKPVKEVAWRLQGLMRQ
jgi:glutathione synthase/RimK-type ligase-like ATP-grasp enzyme